MKKILFCINNMEMGGIQKSLVELLKEIHDLYDITLFCIKSGGELVNSIPQNIKIIYAGNGLKMSELSIKEAFREGIFQGVFRVFLSGFTKAFSKKIPSYIMAKIFQTNLGKYDVAISFSQPIEEHQFYMLANEAVLYSCNSELKISFVHCDFGNYGGNTEYNKKMYLKFDRVAAVSESVREKFVKFLPKMKDRVYIVYNCHDYEYIKKLSLESPILYENKAILTIARLSEEKGLLRVVCIISSLVNQGYDISWHIVGDGPLKEKLLQLIQKYNMDKNIILHGEQINPYKYLKNAFLLLVPSYHEAAPMVFEEAKSLNIPILSTNTLSAKELVEKKKIGWVCENNEESIYEKLKEILDKNFNISIKNFNNSNKEQINQFVELIRKE